MRTQKIKSVKKLGAKSCIDIEVNHPDHNFYANGIVTSNSHSMSYATLSAITLALKANHPLEFLFCCLKMAKYEQDREECVFRISNELRYFGYKLLPPHLKYSDDDYTIEKDGIRFGLLSIKGIQEASLPKIKEFRNNYTNKFEFFEGAKQAGINIGVLSALIQSGAAGDEFSKSRSKLVLEAQLWNLLTPKEKVYCLNNGAKYDFNIIEMVKNINDWVGENGKKLTRPTRLDTIRKKYIPYSQIYKQNSQYEDFANHVYERNLLGISYSKTLKEIFLPACPQLVSIEEFLNIDNNEARVTLVGFVVSVYDGVSKSKGRKYTKITIEDGTGMLSAFAFDGKMGKQKINKREELKKKKKIPKEGDVAAFRGKKFENILILDDISIQSEKIYFRAKDIEVKEVEN